MGSSLYAVTQDASSPDRANFSSLPLPFPKSMHDTQRVLTVMSHFFFTDIKTLAEIMTQRPYKLSSRMTEEEYMVEQDFDQIMTVLKQMPHSLLLVIRWALM